MSLRADQWLILGVVGLGAYALYRLSKTSSVSDPQATPTGDPMRPPQPGVLLPETRGRIEAPASVAFVTGNPNAPSSTMTLSNSRAYRGRGENLTDEDIAFFDVRYVYNTPEAARAAEFPEWALTGASRNTRWFYGRYLGQDATYARPAKIDAMWVTARPPPRVGFAPPLGERVLFPEGREAFFRGADAHAQALIARWRSEQDPRLLAALDTPPQRCVLRAPLYIVHSDGFKSEVPHPPGTVMDVHTSIMHRRTDGELLYNVSEPGIYTIAPLFARVADVRAACPIVA